MPKRPTFEEQAAKPTAPQLPLVKREQPALPPVAFPLSVTTSRVSELEEAHSVPPCAQWRRSCTQPGRLDRNAKMPSAGRNQRLDNRPNDTHAHG